MRPVKEQIDFFENIFNDESLCSLVLASLISADSIDCDPEKQEKSIQISKMILEHFDEIKFKDNDKKEYVKSFLEKVPELIEESIKEWEACHT